MSRTAQLAVKAAGASVLVLVLVAQAALAQAPFPVRTKNFFAWLVRGMDECTAPTLTVMSPGMPAGACPQTNTATDATLTMQSAKLRITQSGKIRLLGRGMHVGDSVRLRIQVRVTQQNVSTDMGSGSVTFSDVTADCPSPPDAFIVKLNGSISGRADLGACLAPASALQNGNVEILDARMINVANGLTVAAPGVLVKP